MEIKKLIVPVILPVLFLAFALVCFMVWFHRGRSARWLARKLKIGGIIITLTTISTGCPPFVTCYVPVETNIFEFDKQQDGFNVTVDLPNDSVLTGKLHNSEGDKFAFTIAKNDTIDIQEGNVFATDGVFDQDPEDIKMTIDSRIDTGIYNLNLFREVIMDDKTERYQVGQKRLKIE
jgi:hypothetical protein